MRGALAVFMIAVVLVAAAGCARISKPYVGNMTRVDQNLESGNRGYLAGTPPPPEERKLTRQLITIDVDVDNNVPDNRIDTFAGRPGVTKTAEPGDVVPANKASRQGSAPASAGSKVVELKREVTVVTEETPSSVRKTTVVTEEEIK
jgi:hypothetical protein